jgi:hypothetical protein
MRQLQVIEEAIVGNGVGASAVLADCIRRVPMLAHKDSPLRLAGDAPPVIEALQTPLSRRQEGFRGRLNDRRVPERAEREVINHEWTGHDVG